MITKDLEQLVVGEAALARDKDVLDARCSESGDLCQEARRVGILQQLLRCQYLYFCTSKASKLSNGASGSCAALSASVFVLLC